MSDLILRGYVSQDTYVGVPEQTPVPVRMNPRGELVTPDWMTQLVLDGRVFNASTRVLETGALLGETARGTDNVNPSLLLNVPVGTTAIPLSVMVWPDGVGTVGDFVVQICTDDAARYSSGGAAVTPINMRKDDANASASTFYDGGTQIVATANTDDDTLYVKRFDSLEILTTPTVSQPFLWTARMDIPPVLFGPASLLVYVVVSNVDQGFMYSVKWAEIPSTSVT